MARRSSQTRSSKGLPLSAQGISNRRDSPRKYASSARLTPGSAARSHSTPGKRRARSPRPPSPWKKTPHSPSGSAAISRSPTGEAYVVHAPFTPAVFGAGKRESLAGEAKWFGQGRRGDRRRDGAADGADRQHQRPGAG